MARLLIFVAVALSICVCLEAAVRPDSPKSAPKPDPKVEKELPQRLIRVNFDMPNEDPRAWVIEKIARSNNIESSEIGYYAANFPDVLKFVNAVRKEYSDLPFGVVA